MAENTEGNPLEGVLPPVEQAPQPEPTQQPAPVETPTEPQYTEVEKRAIEQGWKPLDQWEGDPADHRSARDFLAFGEVLGALKATKQQVKEMQNQLRFMSEHQRKVHQAGYEQALQDLRRQKADAVARGDGEAVVELDEQIDEHKAAIQTIKRAPPAPASAPEPDTSPVFEDWLTQNNWYKTDKSRKIWADAVAVDYARTKATRGERLTEQELYDFLHKEARRVFPEEFRAKQPVRPPSPDSSGRQGSAKAKVGDREMTASQKIQAYMADMPADDRRALENMLRSGFVTEEQFIKDFDLVKNKWER